MYSFHNFLCSVTYAATTRWLVPRLQADNQGALVAVFGFEANAVVGDFASYIDDMMPVIESVILTLPRHLDLRNLEAILTHISEDSRVREAKQRMLRRAVSLFRMDVLEWLMQQDMGDSQDVLWRFAYPTQWPESKFLTDLARPHPHDHAMIAFFAQHDVPLTRMLTMAAMARVGLRPLVYLALGDKANMLRWWKSPTSVLWLEHLVTKIGG
ncbi:hypothetical protein As57867_007465, partial [Aphanomyces stellatus]